MSTNKPLPDENPQRRLRIRIALFLFSAILILFTFSTLTSISNTLNRLNLVETERDQWQRPADVLRGLGAREGSTVVDLGSGAGYFTLKLGGVVGERGEVIAVDLRRLSLFFLRIRALMRNQHNIEIIVGTPDDPHLPTGSDAVLISNTYHEFTNPGVMLDHTWRSLRSGGRLVIVDRGPHVGGAERESGAGAPSHEIPSAVVEAELLRKGFELLSRDDRFIDRPGDDPWWLLVARRP